MSKELESLERVKKFFPFTINELEYQNICIIEAALKEHEEHKQILNDYGLTLVNFREACLLLAMLKGNGRNIHNIDKKLKAFEIIKEKNVNIRGIKETKNFHEYNVKFPTTLNGFLEKQEYDLLKEVLL